MTTEGFTEKERLRFRKLLEVASSTTFGGERDAALAAAVRLADSHGMTLREAAGMSEPEPSAPPRQRPPRANAHYRADFGAAAGDSVGTWWTRTDKKRAGFGDAYGNRPESERVAAEKKRRDEALADAVSRGLDAEERAEEARKAARKKTAYVRTNKRGGSWRSRPEFVRVLLKETAMTAKEIAAAAGVTIYDVFKEKLLMRRSPILADAP